jgi:S-DNA-T family DNA segregation ATPase FtsK/SpoIIIE
VLRALQPDAGVPPSGADGLADDRSARGHPADVGAFGPDGCVAVVGPRARALAVARLLASARVTAAAAHGEPPVHVEVWPRGDDDEAWAWSRWITAPGPEAGVHPAGSTLLVVDGLDGAPPAVEPTVSTGRPAGTRPALGRPVGRSAVLATRHGGPDGGPAVLLVEDDVRRVPGWCRRMCVDVSDRRGSGTAGRPEVVAGAPSGVSAVWADRQARLVAAVRGRSGGPSAGDRARGGTLPRTAALADLPGIPAAEPDAVLAAWGLDASAPDAWRLAASGPDALGRDPSAPDTSGRGASGPGALSVRRTSPRAEGGPGGGLVARLGVGVGGPVLLDLVRDGPHALVAGTTGAGKSELLQTWVLSLALTCSPADLAVLLVDYKGGAGLGACTALPHVVGQVTDLDPALAARALTGLRAELRRRERVLAGWGAADLASLRARAPHAAPPRLLVVVDEFRALADDLPGFVPELLRVAAQGRSLGVHLLLATQRPGGAVGPDLRANLAVRMCLRVTDAADSLDVLDLPDAARIPSALAGRALLRRGPGPLEPVQVALADAWPSARVAPVRRLGSPASASVHAARGTPRAATAPGAAAPAGTAPRGAAPEHGAPGCAAPAGTVLAGTVSAGTVSADTRSLGMVAAWVAAARSAAVRAALTSPEVPWLPELPTTVPLTDLRRLAGAPLDAADGSAGPDAPVAFALADRPAQQRRDLVAWRPWSGPLLVVGAPASGRTTTLRTLAVVGLRQGWQVHTVAAGAPVLDGTISAAAGTCATTDDPRLVARLLTVLCAVEGSPASNPHLLLIDGLDAVLDALGPVARGRAVDRLLELVRDGRRRGVCVAATAPPTLSAGVAGQFADRLVLRVGDRFAESMAGVPDDLAGGHRPPGRAVWLPAAGHAATDRSPGRTPDSTPDRFDRTPDRSDRTPDRSDRAPDRSDRTPDRSDRTRDRSDCTPDPADRTPDRPRRRDDLADATTSDPTGHGPALCQVALAEPPAATPVTVERPPTVRLRPVPHRVTVRDLESAVQSAVRSAGAGHSNAPPRPAGTGDLASARPLGRPDLAVPVGLGGDDAGPVRVRLDRGALVAGPPGSGRSTALAVLATGLISHGHRVLVVARDGPLRVLGERHAPDRTCGFDAADLDAVTGAVLDARCDGRPAVALVDDLDALEQAGPAVALRLTSLTGGGAASRPLLLVASAATSAACLSFRGALGGLRAARRGLVLTPQEAGSSEVFGVDLTWDADPARPHDPGRGVVVHGRETTPVQVARIDPSG